MSLQIGILLITVCIIHIILIMCGLNMYLKNKQHKEMLSMELRKVQLQEQTKLKLLETRIQYEREKIQIELDNQMKYLHEKSKLEIDSTISTNDKIDFKSIVSDLDNIIKSVVEPNLRLKYIKVNKPFEELTFDDIVIPITTENHHTDILELNSQIINNMPENFKQILSKYLSENTFNNMIKNMISLYYFDVINNLKNVKNKLAEEDNSKIGNKSSLFINGMLNPNAGLTAQQKEVIYELSITSMKQLNSALATLAQDKNGVYARYKCLTEINLENYR